MLWSKLCPLKIPVLKAKTLGPEEAALFGERVFTEVIKLHKVIMENSSHNQCSHKKGEIWTQTHRRRLCGGKSKNQDDESTKQGAPTIVSKPPEARGEAWKRLHNPQRSEAPSC